MKYKKDSLAFALCIFKHWPMSYILLYIEITIIITIYQMGISVIYNLLFMLIVFLSAEEVKAINADILMYCF